MQGDGPAGKRGGKRSWGAIRLRAPFWAVVSALLLLYGLLAADPHDAKGRVVLIAVGVFGLLCSLTILLYGLIRRRRDRS